MTSYNQKIIILTDLYQFYSIFFHLMGFEDFYWMRDVWSC